jgi:hypothetical protein
MEWPTKTITDYGMATKNNNRLWNGQQKQNQTMEWPTKTLTDYGMAIKNNNRLWNGQQKQ